MPLNNQKQTRNGNVEAFRCLLMFLIVVYHSFIYGPCSADKALWTYCFTVLICWHTDGFLAISGWYGMKFRWDKIVRFVGQMAFYGVLSVLYCWLADVSCPRPWRYFFGGWFGASYLVLLFLAPAVNWLFTAPDGGRLIRWMLGFGLMTYFLTSWITGRFGAGMVPVKSFGVHSVLLMLYIYFIMRVVHQCLEGKAMRKGWLLAGVGLFFCLLPLYRLVDRVHCHVTGVGIYGLGAYFAAFDAPHTILASVSLLLLFVYYVHLPDWIGRIAIRISPLLFGVYLCHVTTTFGGHFYDIERWLVNVLHLHGFFAVILTAIFVFVVSIGVEGVRKFGLRMLMGIAMRRRMPKFESVLMEADVERKLPVRKV